MSYSVIKPDDGTNFNLTDNYRNNNVLICENVVNKIDIPELMSYLNTVLAPLELFAPYTTYKHLQSYDEIPHEVVGDYLILTEHDSDVVVNDFTSFLKRGSFIFCNSSCLIYISEPFYILYTKNSNEEYILNNTETRIQYRNRLMELFEQIKSEAEWCQYLPKTVDIKCNLGAGCWGSVVSAEYNKYIFAVKYAKLKKDAIKHVDDRNYSSWNEISILTDILSPLISGGVCQNLPLIYSSFTCKVDSEHNPLKQITLSENDSDKYYSTIILEKGDCTLSKWFDEKERTEEELYNALFQILYGLHVIQMKGQIMHYDIKSENILCYKVKSGGCWEYTVDNEVYYIPNNGWVFVLSDFGLSRPMSSEHIILKNDKENTFRIGHRFGLVDDDGNISPIQSLYEYDVNSSTFKNAPKVEWENGTVSHCGESRLNLKTGEIMNIKYKLTPTQLGFVKSKNIFNVKELIKHPSIMPPFEFIHDTQDVLKMFVGGSKRSTQRGDHSDFKLNQYFINRIRPYIRVDVDKNPLNAYTVLSGFLIKKIFENRFKSKKEKIIQSFDINK